MSLGAAEVTAMTECFRSVDTDNSGFIDMNELEKVIGAFCGHTDIPAGHKQLYNDPAKVKAACENFMKQADTNGDRKISLGEFIDYFTKKMQSATAGTNK
jgi:Ca2+-binding EF-hand superfamily protein